MWRAAAAPGYISRMQYIIVAILVVAAVALVILPLVRTPRDAGAGDIDAPEPQRRREEVAPRQPPAPGPALPPSAAPQPPGESGAEELPTEAPPPAAPARPLGAAADPATEQEILRYREALRARTICPACSSANAPGSKFCRECGEGLVVGGAAAGSLTPP